MITRLLTVFALLPLGVFVVFSSIGNGFPAFLSCLIVALIISYEIFSLMEKKGYKYYIWINSIAITLNFMNYFLYGSGIYSIGFFFIIMIAIVTLFCLLILVIESTSGQFKYSMENIGISLFGFILLGVFLPLLILIKMMDLSGWILSVLMFITFLTDTGGFVVGKIFGRTKIKFLSSPNKTVEGYIGSLLFGLLTGAILYIVQRGFALTTSFTISEMFIITISVILSSFIGDLGESTLKRWANSKDSSDLLPGHGGFFDRFDSLIFTAPVFYSIMKLLGY